MPQSNGGALGRKKAKKLEIRQILILCEDTKSSRDYLASYPYNKELVQIHCIGTGKNTDSLMLEAIKRASDAARRGNAFEQVWVVFDKDSFTQQQFNRTFDLAKSRNEIIACWSNESFELWYLLHFHYRDTAIARKELVSNITKLIGKKYDKADLAMYAELKDRTNIAIRNASRLAFENSKNGDPHRNPSTLVHELVNRLLDLAKIEQEE